jgi:hypothetical protein
MVLYIYRGCKFCPFGVQALHFRGASFSKPGALFSKSGALSGVLPDCKYCQKSGCKFDTRSFAWLGVLFFVHLPSRFDRG